MDDSLSFKLNNDLAYNLLDTLPDPFINNPIGYITFARTYPRVKSDGTKENWKEVCIRVVSGCYSLMKDWVLSQNIGWSETQALDGALKMLEKIYTMKFLPPGRGLWALGTPIVHTKKMGEALYNCCFISTEYLHIERSAPFRALMDCCMMGVGVALDTNGANKVSIKCPTEYEDENLNNSIKSQQNKIKKLTKYLENILKNPDDNSPYAIECIKTELEFVSTYGEYCHIFKIPDTREGWVESVGMLIDSYLDGSEYIIFDYSEIRAKGIPLKTFGGLSSGPEPLIHCHSKIRVLSELMIGQNVNAKYITDVANLIGRAVVAGNVRRTAELILDDCEILNPNNKIDLNDPNNFVNMKNYELNPDRVNYGWSSNNSIRCVVGHRYDEYVDNIVKNGEPGFLWLDNVQTYGRMIDGPSIVKDKATGTNPCGEISLEGSAYGELYNRLLDIYGSPLSVIESIQEHLHDKNMGGGEYCCLVETILNKITDLDDFLETIKYAYIYCKVITLAPLIWKGSAAIQKRNRRLGISLTGIQQFIHKQGIAVLQQYCMHGYPYLRNLDNIYSAYLTIRESIKITTIKPSGTVSLLSGSTSGMHWAIKKRFIRRIRINKEEKILLHCLTEAGYYIEDDVYNSGTTSIVSIPCDLEDDMKTEDEVSIWEQFEMAVFLQEYWSDNQVSCTIKFDPVKERDQILSCLNKFQFKLKGISLLPNDNTAYPQMPYEAISLEQYKEMIKDIKPIDLTPYFKQKITSVQIEQDRFCDGDKCLRIKH